MRFYPEDSGSSLSETPVVESQKATFIVTAVVSRNISQTVTRYNTKTPSVLGGEYLKSRLCVPWRTGYVLSSLTFVTVSKTEQWYNQRPVYKRLQFFPFENETQALYESKNFLKKTVF